MKHSLLFLSTSLIILVFSQKMSIEQQNKFLEEIYFKDQYVRKSINNCTANERNKQDSISISLIDKYLLDFGFPFKIPLSQNAIYGIYYPIQHADLYRQQLYIDSVKILVDLGKLEMKKYVMMYDRILDRTIGKQKYGEQLYADLSDSTFKFVPFINRDSVNYYRQQLGLDTIDLDRKMRMIIK